MANSYKIIKLIDRADNTTGIASKLVRSAIVPAMLGITPIPMPAAANTNPIAFAPCSGPSCSCRLVTISAQIGANVKP